MKICPVFCECGEHNWQLLMKSQAHQCVACGYKIPCKDFLKLITIEGMKEDSLNNQSQGREL